MDDKEVKQKPTEIEMLPEHMRGPMERYIMNGLRPGGFLEAVLANDLRGAFQKADDTNKSRIGDFVNFLSWHAPWSCWGDKSAVEFWVNHGGWNGICSARSQGLDELQKLGQEFDRDSNTESEDVGY